MPSNLTHVSTEDLLRELIERGLAFARDMTSDNMSGQPPNEIPTRNQMVDIAVDYICHTMPEVLEVEETDLGKERASRFEMLLVDIAVHMVTLDSNLIAVKFIPK